MELGQAGLRRARVAAQRLDGRRPVRRVEEAVAATVGVQAQDERAAALGIRARSTGLVRGDVDRAVTRDRTVVLTWSLRGTRHYHLAEDARWLVGLLGPAFARPGARARQLGIGGAVGDRAVAALRDALAAGGPLTRDEVKERLAPVGVEPHGQAVIHVIHRAALEGVLCVVPGMDGPERYVVLDDWVPRRNGDRIDGDAAVAELARRYLAGFGPATVDDFAAWSGLGAKAAASGWKAMAHELTEVRVRGGPRAWVLSGDAGRARDAAATQAPLRLLGGFDSLVLGYADRRAHLDPSRARDVNRGGGIVKPVVIDDGRIVGTWRYRAGGRIAVEPFDPLSPRKWGSQTPSARRPRRPGAVEAEARDVARFLGDPQARTEIPMPPGVVAP